ncbi:MAG: sulfatase-like hydrolase/transferase [Planctomycetota bacterium]|nr:sulfatase-like hydrolase/transferase [Planctomycetota bacterium]
MKANIRTTKFAVVPAVHGYDQDFGCHCWLAQQCFGLAAVWIMTLLVSAFASSPLLAAEQRPPNIVFIMADDLGINDLSCYGRTDQSTPHLDRLAKQGIRFTNAYAAQSVCSPTRAAIMTGKSPARLHLTTFLPGRPDTPSQLLLHPAIQQQLPLSDLTIAERLKAAGYATACIGKWHLGGEGYLPTDQGFDLYHPGQSRTTPTETEGSKGEFDLTAAAEKFIEQNKGRPFFLYLPHHTPHVRLDAHESQKKKHAAAFNPVYAAMIETMDASVGRLVARIDELGLSDNTLIVFTSDNGGLHVPDGDSTPATHNTPYRAGKGYGYDGGLRIPLIARWTGTFRPDQTIQERVISTDWPVTMLALAGVKTADQFDGVSLSELLKHGTPLAQRALYWHLPHYTNQGSRPFGAILDGDRKLIEHYEDGRCELFDVAADIGEATDISSREPATVAQLRGKLEKWRRDLKVQSNTANPRFNDELWQQLYRKVDTSNVRPETTAAATELHLSQWRAGMNRVVSKKQKQERVDIAELVGTGAVILSAADAKVHGTKLTYESEPHKDTLGRWTDSADYASWEFEVPRPGTYQVELLLGCGKEQGGSKMELTCNDQSLTFTVPETGHYQRFVPTQIGELKFVEAAPQSLTIKVLKQQGVGAMDLRRITLRGITPDR